MEAELRLQALEVSCQAIRDQLRRFSQFVSSDNPDLAELDIRYQAALPLLEKFTNAAQEVRRIDTSNDCNSAAFEAEYFRTLAQAQSLRPSASTSGPVMQTISHAGQQITLVSSNPNPNLKPPDIPSFDGTFEKFKPFIDMFEALIDSDKFLNQIQKFHFLRHALRGEAAKLIETLQFTAENYQIALKLLKSHYENEKLRIFEIVHQVAELPKVDSNNFHQIKTLSFQFSQAINVLKTLDLVPIQNDPFLCYLILSKFDEPLFKAWEKHYKSRKQPKWQGILDFLVTQSQLCQAVDCHFKGTKGTKYRSSNKEDSTGRVTKSYRESTSKRSTMPNRPMSNLATSSSSNSRWRCYHCSGQHMLSSCPKFRTIPVADRIAFITKIAVCKKCFSKKHPTENCTRSDCSKCGAHHNTFIHVDKNQRPHKVTFDPTTPAMSKEPK